MEEQAISFVEQLTKQAPLVAALVGVVAIFAYVGWRIVSQHQRFEHARDELNAQRQDRRDKVISDRHTEYFRTLEDIATRGRQSQERIADALAENTRVLGEASETNRAVREALLRRAD